MSNITDDLKDGVVLMLVVQKIGPEKIIENNNARIIKEPRNRFHELENCQNSIKLGKKMGFTVSN